jgi:hypothetical protein
MHAQTSNDPTTQLEPAHGVASSIRALDRGGCGDLHRNGYFYAILMQIPVDNVAARPAGKNPITHGTTRDFLYKLAGIDHLRVRRPCLPDAKHPSNRDPTAAEFAELSSTLGPPKKQKDRHDGAPGPIAPQAPYTGDLVKT